MIKVTLIHIGANLLDKFPLIGSPEARFTIARNIMEGARAKLITMAQEKLHSTRADYINGIQPIGREGKEVVLTLAGVLPNMVEHGWDARFLHETLLSDEVSGWKVSKEGNRYRSIPFRHKTPGTGSQGGQPMGTQYAANKNPMSQAAPHTIVEDSIKLGKRIHGQAKKLITRKEAGQGVKGKSALQEGLAPKLRQHHRSDIFAGMIVNKQAVQKSGAPKGQVGFQRTYTTFRTISEANPGSFYHPGIKAREFMDTLDEYVAKVTPGAFEAYIQEILK